MDIINFGSIHRSKYFLLLALALLCAGARAEKKTVLSGKIKDYKERSFKLSYQSYALLSDLKEEEVQVSADGSFSFTVHLDAPTRAFISLGKLPTTERFAIMKADGTDTTMTTQTNSFLLVYLYLLPGDRQKVEVSALDIVHTLQVGGKHADNSLYLNEEDWHFNNYKEKHLKNYYGYANYPLEMYKEYVEKRKNARLAYLDEFAGEHKISKHLAHISRQSIVHDATIALINYPQMRASYTRTDYEAPNGYYAFLDTVSIDDSERDKGLAYYYFLDYYLKTRYKLANMDRDYFDYVESILNGKTLYEYNAWALGSNFKRRLYELFGSDCPYPALAKRVKEKYWKMEAMLDGNPVPSVFFYDLEGKKVDIADLKGKFLYLDFWATWCGPCIAEIPALKELQEAYQDRDILFVSISVDKERDKEKWKNFVQQKNLGGVQLWIDNENNQVLKETFNILQIPRFILLDKEGRIVDANALRPSDKRVRQLLDGAM